MTVKELIAQLRTLPDYAPVLINDIDGETLLHIQVSLFGSPAATEGEMRQEFVVIERRTD